MLPCTDTANNNTCMHTHMDTHTHTHIHTRTHTHTHNTCRHYTWLLATANTHTFINFHFTVDSRPTLRTCTVVATIKVETCSFILTRVRSTFIDVLLTSEPSVSRRAGAREGQLVVDDNTSTCSTILTSVSCTGFCVG